jgi:hypothetical protein
MNRQSLAAVIANPPESLRIAHGKIEWRAILNEQHRPFAVLCCAVLCCAVCFGALSANAAG